MSQQPIAANSDLEQQALSQLNACHYKEASALYKKLWQETEDKKWQQQLAFCYLQRTLSFADRGMIKEALVLWDNYTEHAEPPYQGYDQYICWLIQSKNKNKIQHTLKQLSSQQLDNQYPALAALLGLLMLTEHPEFQQDLPQDSALIAHFKIVQTALQALQTNNKDEINLALKSIPYRSAFKDFRPLLNAFQLMTESKQQAQELLAKIPASSVYSQTARLLSALTLDGHELVQTLVNFSHAQRKLIAKIKGYNKKQQEFIDYLIRHNDRLTDKVKFNAAIQAQPLCGSEFSQQICQALLANFPAGRRDFNKHFSALNAFEDNRLKAMASESEDNAYDAGYYWLQCIAALKKEKTDNKLKIALILRHIAKSQPPSEDRTQLLIDSLEYDPEDLSSYQQLLHDLSQYDEDIDQYKHWLKTALEKFPENIEILTQAIKTATANKAYKKASQYALKVLKVDPLNTFAKEILFSSHLAHARRLIQSKKHHLVDNEIKQAEKLKLGKNHLIQTQLLRGLFCFAAEDKKKGLKLIADSLNQPQLDPVNACFQLAMEALLIDLPYTTILKTIPSAKEHLLSERELKRVIQQLNRYEQDDSSEPLLHKALAKIKPALKASLSQQNYDEEVFLSLNQALLDCNAFELSRYCSRLALARWDKSIWHYYQTYSSCDGRAKNCSISHINRLEHLLGEAKYDKDKRATLLINSFIEDYYNAHPQHSMGFLENFLGFGDDDEDNNEEFFEDPLDALFGHLPESIQHKISNRMDSLFKKTSPEHLVNDLIKNTANTQQVFLAMMKDPDLLTALMILKSADSLKIDIDVSIADVLKVFNIDHRSNKLPF